MPRWTALALAASVEHQEKDSLRARLVGVRNASLAVAEMMSILPETALLTALKRGFHRWPAAFEAEPQFLKGVLTTIVEQARELVDAEYAAPVVGLGRKLLGAVLVMEDSPPPGSCNVSREDFAVGGAFGERLDHPSSKKYQSEGPESTLSTSTAAPSTRKNASHPSVRVWRRSPSSSSTNSCASASAASAESWSSYASLPCTRASDDVAGILLPPTHFPSRMNRARYAQVESAAPSSERCACGASLTGTLARCGQCEALAATQPSPERCEVLEGKWELHEVLGEGGMGKVYRARDLTLDRFVAVKVLSPRLLALPDFVERFDREARAMAQLEHPNLVPIFAVGTHAGAPFIVMKYLEGSSLEEHLRRRTGRLSLPEVLAIARPVCAGLSFIHARGAIHRDVKPANIFISPDGSVTLLDLGLVKTSEARQMTRTGAAMGTAAYMSPEQTAGSVGIDHRTDLYALGVLLFELLTGVRPYSGQSDIDLMLAHRQAPVPDARARCPELSTAVAAVIRRAMAKSPQQRFASATELLDALDQAHQAAAPLEPRRRSRWVKAPVAAALVLVGAALAWHRSSPPEPLAKVAEPVTAQVPSHPVSAPAPLSAAGYLPREPAPTRVRPSKRVSGSSVAPAAVAAAPVALSPAPETSPTHPAPEVVSGAPGKLQLATSRDGKPLYGAFIEVDGERLEARTPTTLELPLGQHRIRVLHDCCSPAEELVIVSFDSTRLALPLRKRPENEDATLHPK